MYIIEHTMTVFKIEVIFAFRTKKCLLRDPFTKLVDFAC